jgi:hypothetical protein
MVAQAPLEALATDSSGFREVSIVVSKGSGQRGLRGASDVLTAATILYRRLDLVAVKPGSGDDGVWFAQLQEDIKEEKMYMGRAERRLKISKSVTPARPSIRYFDTVNDDDAGAEAAVQNGEVLYRFHSEDTVNVCAIYSSVKYDNALYELPALSGGRLKSFTVPADRIREYVDLINEGSKAEQEAERTGIRVDDEASSDDDDDGGSSEGSDVDEISYHERMGITETTTVQSQRGRVAKGPSNYADWVGRKGQKRGGGSAPDAGAAKRR